MRRDKRDGGLGKTGKELFRGMERLNIILDATHLCDDSFWEAMDNFRGHVWASHHNCRTLVNPDRRFSDEQIKELIARGAVIGGVLDAWMLVPNWVRKESTPQGMNYNLKKSSTTWTIFVSLRETPATSALVRTWMALLARNRAPMTWRRSLIFRNYRNCSQNEGIRKNDIENVMHGNCFVSWEKPGFKGFLCIRPSYFVLKPERALRNPPTARIHIK